ncbi:hypothetical protein [Microbulbifer guangxiensis]|uniref:hypothetical protein n=1 Tax=Microbulbifer guangxiensis TaxID=2904249 RepID=UPI001F1CA540|nr:hypothetical protein [Microbulbifer guangxiensis]
MRASILISLLFVCVSSLSSASEAVDKEKLKYIIDGWSAGSWDPVVIRYRKENGWVTSPEEQPASVKKDGPYGLTFYNSNGEPEFKIDLSSGYYVTTSYNKEKKIFDKTSLASFVSYDLKAPDNFTFLVAWEDASEDGSKSYSEGTRIGPYKSWSGFNIDSEGGRKYKYSNIFNAEGNGIASK